jgi:hypothetical protein
MAWSALSASMVRVSAWTIPASQRETVA